MKKITLCLIAFITLFNLAKAQPVFYYEAPLSDNSTTQVRAPNGTNGAAYMRACALVLASELTNIPVNTTLTSFGFTINSGANVTVPGSFTLYLENTTDVTFNKSLTFSTAIVPMTIAYASTMSLPGSALTNSITVTLSTPFVYTGGGIYVAYDWFSSGPFATTPVTYRSNSTGLVGGCASAASNASAPTTLGSTSFRPCFLFGAANTFTNEIQTIGMEAPGRVAGMFNTPHNIVTLVRNSSNTTKTNIPVTLNVTGANPFVNTQTITSLASGAVTSVTFAAFNPTIAGLNTLSVSLPPDQNNTNNSVTYNQSVTCNEWAMNPANVSYTMGSVGFNTGSGIISVSYSNPVASSLSGIRGAVSTNTPSVGNAVWGVLLSSAGVTLATTNTLTITNAMLGTFQTFTFSTPVNLNAGTNYYIGFAQPANATLSYFPMGVYNTAYVPYLNYVTTSTLGGTPAPLTSNLGYFGLEAIFTPSVPIIAPSQTISCGNSAVLSATSTSNYTWSTGPSNTSISVSPIVNTNYSIALNNGLCAATKIVSVQVTPIAITIASATNQICLGQNLSLSGSGASSYTWLASNGSSVISSNFTDNPTTNATYTLFAENTNGCSNSAVYNVTVNPLPNISITSNTNIICLGETVTLTALGSSISYTWNTMSNNNSIIENPTSTSVYTVLGSSNLNCVNIATFAVTVNSYTPGLTSTSNSVCLGAQVTLTATGGAANTYSWSTGATFFSLINVSPSVTTIYTVAAFSQLNNCFGSNSISIQVLQNPTVTASPSRTQMCVGEKNILTATGASTYSWSTTDLTNTVQINPTFPSTTIYSVTGTDNNGCSNSTTLSLRINACTGFDNQISNNDIKISLFPNPSKNLVTLTVEGISDDIQFAVYNLIGGLIKTAKLDNQQTVIDLESQAPGIYLVQIIQNGKNIKTAKIIKE